MSYHIYKFYETEPVIIRIALAVSFDLMVVVCFYLLKDEFLAKIKKARQATWTVLLVLIVFQLYVNIWAYWDLHPFRAILSGSIFPVVVGLISYISSLRQHQQEKKETKKKFVPRSQASADSVAQTETSSTPTTPPNTWKGLRVEKDKVRSVFNSQESIDQFIQLEKREALVGKTRERRKTMSPINEYLNSTPLPPASKWVVRCLIDSGKKMHTITDLMAITAMSGIEELVEDLITLKVLSSRALEETRYYFITDLDLLHLIAVEKEGATQINKKPGGQA
jgi:hypothetical protein